MDYYARKVQQGKRHNQALIALARRRCDVLFAMLAHIRCAIAGQDVQAQVKRTLARDSAYASQDWR
jgi:hypothetical protein